MKDTPLDYRPSLSSNTVAAPSTERHRIGWLFFSRLAVATFLLGVLLFMESRGSAALGEISAPHYYRTLLAAYLLSGGFLLLHRFWPDVRLNVYIQCLCDILLITAMVYATGGIASSYSAFYPIVIIYAVLFLGKPGGIVAASACSIVYGLMIDLLHYRILPLPDVVLAHEYPTGVSFVVQRLSVHILSFYATALLAIFVVEREARARVLLIEQESAFNRLDRLYRIIIESIDTGIMTIDLEGHIKSFNQRAERITGFRRHDIENRRFDEVFPDWAEKCTARAAEADIRVELRYVDTRGITRILGCSRSCLREATGEKIGDVLIFQDLTQQKEMEATVEKSRRLAFVGEMAASLAHELRNPLASISGSVQILKRDLMLRESDERLMEIILRGKEQLESFIRDFLLLARPLAPDKPREALRFDDIAREVSEALPLSDNWRDGVHFEMRLAAAGHVRADRSELRQILWNLLLNALQAMPSGGAIDLETRDECQPGEQPWVLLSLRDSGIGMPPDQLKQIFEPFYTTKERGTGLGLSIVHRIVESLGGRIEVKSEVGCGTTVIIRLPALQE